MYIALVGLEVSGDCHGVGCDHTAKLQLSYEQDKSERAPGYAGDSSRGARTVAEEQESGFTWWWGGELGITTTTGRYSTVYTLYFLFS